MNLEDDGPSSQLPVVPSGDLPTLSDWISSLFGFQVSLPSIKMPQTIKNLDKALGMVIFATGENVAERMHVSTKAVTERGSVDRRIIKAGGAAAIERIQIDPELAQRAARYASNDVLRKQGNRERVIELMVEELRSEGDENGEPISSDWLSQAALCIENKSGTDVQILWAKILAGEIRQPGRFSLRFLAFLGTIDHALAIKILHVLSCAINKKFIFRRTDCHVDLQDNQPLSFDALLEMEEAGILTGVAGTYGEYLKELSFPEEGGTMVLKLELVDKCLSYRIPQSNDLIGSYVLTQVAQKLLTVIKPDRPPSSYIEMIKAQASALNWIEIS